MKLDTKSNFRAAGELEDEVVKQKALETMRAWLDKNSHIRCRRDDSFLLRFLRVRKYSCEEAQQQLTKYLKIRSEQPQWHSRLDVHSPELADIINAGFFFALPQRDSTGRRVFFNKASVLDPSVHSSTIQMRAMLLCFETLLEDEENQVKGFTYVMDEKDVGFSIISSWSLGEVTKAIQCCEKTIPLSHREVHILNLSFMFTTIFELVKSMISEKLVSRIKLHAQVEDLHKIIDKKILPLEYGGVEPMSSMINKYRAEAEAVREKVLSLDKMYIEKTGCTSAAKPLLRTLQKVQHSFRKFEID